MKKLSISTFGIFVFCLCLRTYSYLSYEDLKGKVSSNESLMADDKRKTIALLNTLNDLSDKGVHNPNFRELSSLDASLQRNKDSLIISFIENFYASKENLQALKSIQKEIAALNEKMKVANSPLEYLDLELIYYFIIKENFDLRDFQGSLIFEDLGFNREAMVQIRKESQSERFKYEIYKFKNIFVEEVISNEDDDLDSNQELSEVDAPKDRLEFTDLPEDAQIEFLQAAEDQEIDLEKKLQEMDYTPEEIEEMLTGFEL